MSLPPSEGTDRLRLSHSLPRQLLDRLDRGQLNEASVYNSWSGYRMSLSPLSRYTLAVIATSGTLFDSHWFFPARAEPLPCSLLLIPLSDTLQKLKPGSN